MNLFIVWRLGGHGHDMNIRAAWIHMLGDAMNRVAIIAGAIGIHYTGWQENRSGCCVDPDWPDDRVVRVGELFRIP